MKCQTDLAEGDNHACVSTDRSWYCSWVSCVKLWNMNSSILQTLPSFSRQSVAQDFRWALSSSFPGSIVCTHLWSISSKANLITAQQVDYVVVQLPVPSKVFLFLVNVCALSERTFSFACRRTLRRRSTPSTEGMCLFPHPLRVSLLCKAFNRDNFPKTRAAKKNPCWQLHFMASSTSILSLVFADEAANGAKSEWSSIGPAFVELRALTRTSTAWKIPTHTSGLRRPYFSVLMLRPQELWSLKKLPCTIFVVHATTWKWRSLDSRRLLGFQSSTHATCKQRWVWPGAGGQQLGRFRRKFFFCIFGKSYARGGRETKKIITVA